jgi:hypothetical protein
MAMSPFTLNLKQRRTRKHHAAQPQALDCVLPRKPDTSSHPSHRPSTRASNVTASPADFSLHHGGTSDVDAAVFPACSTLIRAEAPCDGKPWRPVRGHRQVCGAWRTAERHCTRNRSSNVTAPRPPASTAARRRHVGLQRGTPCEGTPWTPATCRPHCAHGTGQRPGSQKLWCLVATQAAATAGASPALIAFTPDHSPIRGLTGGLSARRPAALPPDTATRGWTVSQLPSGVDGISFTVHPEQPGAVRYSTDGQDTSDMDSCEANGGSSPFPLDPR